MTFVFSNFHSKHSRRYGNKAHTEKKKRAEPKTTRASQVPIDIRSFFCSSIASMAKHSKSKRSRRSRSSSDSDSDSSSGSSSSFKSFSSTLSDIADFKVKKFTLSRRKASVIAKWATKGVGEKNLKAAREAFRPDVKRDKKAKFCASELFTNPKVDETLYTALKAVKNSSASVANVDPLEKIYRKQTDTALDMAKPLFLLLNGKKRKRDKKDAEAIRTLSVIWSHHFRELTHARRLNILSQTHPNHVGLLSRAADKLPVGGEDLFGPDFITELVSQVKTAAQVSSSLAGPAATSTPAKSNDRRSPPPLHDSRNNNRYVDFSSSLFSPGFCDTAYPVDACVSRVAGRTSLFVDAWARLTKDPWVLSTVAFGFQLDFINDPPFQLSIPPNASMDDIQFDLCAAEVDALIKKGAVVETEEKGGYISRYFLVPKKGPNEWRPIIN